MSPSSRTRVSTTAALLLCGILSWPQVARAWQGAPPRSTLAPIQRHQQQPRAPKPNGEHLAEWMNRHSNLNPQQQQQALESEPGFHDLPPQTQQRMRDRLTQLNSMSPEQRQRLLERNEAMEHLNPDQRAQVRGAMKQLADLPEDQRRYVARTFRGLRELSPAQRENVLSSERFDHLTPEQRSALTSLMKVEPLLPPPYDSGGVAHATPKPN